MVLLLKTGLLIAGHGSRSKDAQNTFDKIVGFVRELSSYEIVEGAHMELSEPHIPEQIKKMVNEGIEEIIIVPYFLYEGIHIKEDIPEIIKEEKEKYKNIIFKFAKPIGAEPALAEILIKRAQEVKSEK